MRSQEARGHRLVSHLLAPILSAPRCRVRLRGPSLHTGLGWGSQPCRTTELRQLSRWPPWPAVQPCLCSPRHPPSETGSTPPARAPPDKLCGSPITPRGWPSWEGWGWRAGIHTAPGPCRGLGARSQVEDPPVLATTPLGHTPDTAGALPSSPLDPPSPPRPPCVDRGLWSAW